MRNIRCSELITKSGGAKAAVSKPPRPRSRRAAIQRAEPKAIGRTREVVPRIRRRGIRAQERERIRAAENWTGEQVVWKLGVNVGCFVGLAMPKPRCDEATKDQQGEHQNAWPRAWLLSGVDVAASGGRLMPSAARAAIFGHMQLLARRFAAMPDAGNRWWVDGSRCRNALRRRKLTAKHGWVAITGPSVKIGSASWTSKMRITDFARR